MVVLRPLLPDPRPGPGRHRRWQYPAHGVRQDKPGHAVKPGDVVTLGKGADILAVRVLALAERRGPALEAQKLYKIVE